MGVPQKQGLDVCTAVVSSAACWPLYWLMPCTRAKCCMLPVCTVLVQQLLQLQHVCSVCIVMMIQVVALSVPLMTHTGSTPKKNKFIIICPMRQQHWTDYKISLCVCQSVSQSVNFGPPFISRERLKLETKKWHTDWPLGVLTKKCKIRSKGVDKGHVTYFLKFWYPLHIWGTVKARNFKFGTQIGHGGT